MSRETQDTDGLLQQGIVHRQLPEDDPLISLHPDEDVVLEHLTIMAVCSGNQCHDRLSGTRCVLAVPEQVFGEGQVGTPDVDRHRAAQ